VILYPLNIISDKVGDRGRYLTPVVPKPYMKGEEMMAENISWMK
jgi:hypothetical protein